MNAIEEYRLTINSPSAPGVESVVRVNEQPEAMRLFFNITDCLSEALRNGQPSQTMFRNRRMAIALGTDLVVPLDAAHVHWQTIAAMSDWTPCHCCDTGNGKWAQIEIDHADIAYVGRSCEACWAALGMDGDCDE